MSAESEKDRALALLGPMTAEQIEGAAQGDVDLLAALYLGELSSLGDGDDVTRPYAVMKKKWLPLLRRDEIFEALEPRVGRLERQSPSALIGVLLRSSLDELGQVRKLTDRQTERYFTDRDTPEKVEALEPTRIGHVYFNEAKAAKAQGDVQSAAILFQRAIKAFEKAADKGMLGRCNQDLAALYADAHRYPETLPLLARARVLFEQSGDTINAALCYNNLGYALSQMGRHEDAYEQGVQGLRLLKPEAGEAAGDLAEVAERLGTLLVETTRREQRSAEDQAGRLLEVAGLLRSSDMRGVLARPLLEIAGALSTSGRHDDAYLVAKDALRLADRSYFAQEVLGGLLVSVTLLGRQTGRSPERVTDELKEGLGVPPNVSRLGDLQTSLVGAVGAGSLSEDEAIRQLEAAHHLAPFDAEAVFILSQDINRVLPSIDPSLPQADAVLGRYAVYLRLLGRAAELVGVPGLGSFVMFDLANVRDKRGQLREAAGAFEEAAELASRAGMADYRTSMLFNVAEATRRQGDVRGAIRRLNDLLAQLDAAGQVHREPEVLAALAWAHGELGDLEREEALSTRALVLLEEIDEAALEAGQRLDLEGKLRERLGWLLKRDQRFAGAIEHYERAVAIARSRDDPHQEAIALGNLASVHLDLGDRARARALYDRAYDQVRRYGVSPSYSHIFSGRAMILSEMGQRREAREMARFVVDHFASPDGLVIAYAVLAGTADNEEDRAVATANLQRLLHTCADPVKRMGLAYELLGIPDLPAGQREECIHVIRAEAKAVRGLPGIIWNERAARLLVDQPEGRSLLAEHLQLSLGHADDLAASNPPAAIRRQIYTHAAPAVRGLLRLTDDGCEQLELILRTKARGTLNERWPPVTTLAGLQVHLQQAPSPVVVVEMFEWDGEVRLYFVRRDSLPAVERLGRSTDWLLGDGRAVMSLGDPRVYPDAWRSEAWTALSSELGAMVARHARPGEIVAFIPSGYWHFLPLHACRCDGLMLLLRNPVVYGPSSAVLARCGDPRRKWAKALVVGVDFEGEARSVADWFGGDLIDHRLAYPQPVAMQMETYDLVHFSTHGVYVSGGELSGLQFSDGGWLTPAVLEGHSTTADLVCASACETSVNFVTAGGDLIGLDVAFLNMGATSVLGTLWPVEAAATERLVTAFYRHLTGGKGRNEKVMSKAHALQAAVKDQSQHPDLAPPYFWAAFKLSGGWL